MKKYFGVVLVLVVIVIYLSGCFYDSVIPESDLNSEDTGDGVVPGKGTLKIYLTDAPGDYLEVNIIISKIEGHIALEDEEGYWETLKEWPNGLPVDLIKLEDRFMLLASLELETNKYTQLRLFLMDEEEDAWIILEGSEGPTLREPLEIPSSANTGIKLNRPFEIVAGSITKLTIDFDAEKSVIKTGNGKYKMKPVIHMTSEINPEEAVNTGSVFGTVSYYGYDNGNSELILKGINGADVSLSGGEYIFVYNTTTSEDGSFEFSEDVPIGNCVLNVYAEGFNPYSESIEVIAGPDTEVNVVLLSGGISGIVKEEGSELKFIAEATVTVILSGGDIFSSFASTNAYGEFVFGQLPVGSYELTVSADDYSFYLHAVEIAVTADATTNIGVIGLELLALLP